MSNDITLVSTTDSPEAVQEALTGVPATPATPAEPAATPDAKATETPAATPPATPAETPAAPPAEAKPAETPAVAETDQQKAARERQETRREKRINGIKEEIDRLVARRSGVRDDLEAEEARLAELRQARQDLEAGRTPATPAATPVAAATPTPVTVAPTRPEPVGPDEVGADGKPKYPQYEDFIKDVAKWHAEQARAQTTAEDAQRRAEATRAHTERANADRVYDQAVARYNDKLAAFQEHTPDIGAVIENARPAIEEIVEELGQHALNVIDTYTVFDADNGPAINHFLAQHPDEMKRIAALPVPQQLAHLGRLDERLGRAATPDPARVPATPVTRAPEPIQPVSSTPTASSVSPDDEPYPVWRERRNREEREQRTGVR